MKHSILLLCSFFPLLLWSQCEQTDYDYIIRLVQEDLKSRTYQRAINRLLDARDICPDEKVAVNRMIKQAFEQIEGEKQKADAALDVANRVLDQMYFYEGKFGLTLKGSSTQGYEQYHYGFIDRQGREVIPFDFEKATPFSTNDGFARVSKEGQKYLLDTTGTTYLLAERWEELHQDIEALDLHEADVKALPDSLGDYSNLKVLLLYEERWYLKGSLTKVPASIGKLKQLRVLDLHSNKVGQLPESFGQLTSLRILKLSHNSLRELPESFGELQALQSLYLDDNRLRNLPQTFAQLQGLQSLDLGSNRFSTFPEAITDLRQLSTLQLVNNQLRNLPPDMCALKRIDLLRWDRKSPIFSNNPLQSIPACLLDRLTQQDLQEWVMQCLYNSLYHVAYQSLENLLRRFPDTPQKEKDELIARLEGSITAGEQHEDLPRMLELLN